MSKGFISKLVLFSFLVSGFMSIFAMQQRRRGTRDIYQAIEKGSIKSIQRWLDKGVDINDGSLLNVAIESGKAEIAFPDVRLNVVRFLLDKGAPLEPIGEESSPLMLAVELGYLDIVKELLARGANVKAVDENGDTALIMASRAGNEALVEELLFANVDVNAVDNEGLSAFSYASSGRNLPIMRLLRGKGADVDIVNNQGSSLLHNAAFKGDSAVVAELLALGANKEVVDKNGYTPLLTAVKHGMFDVVSILHNSGANVRAIDKEGNSALVLISGDHPNLVTIFLNYGVDIDVKNLKGQTALIRALSERYIQTATVLIERGAQLPEVVDSQGNSPLHIAVHTGSLQMIRALCDRKVDIEARNNEGKTALMLALENNSSMSMLQKKRAGDALLVLISHGAQIEFEQALSIVRYAISVERKDVLQALEKRGFTRDAIMNALNAQGESFLIEYINKRNAEATLFLLDNGADPFIKDRAGFNAFDYVRVQQQQSKIFLLFLEKYPHETMVGISSTRIVPVEGGSTPTEIHYAKFREIIEKKYGKVRDDFIVQACIEQERLAYQNGNYVFYRSEPGKYRIYEYFLEDLDSLVRSFDKSAYSFIFTRFFKDAASEQTINQYMDTKSCVAVNKDSTKNMLLSANIPLFGNVNLPSSCTWDYFINNREQGGVGLRESFERVFSLYGFDKSYIDLLLQLQQGGVESSASLHQIIVPKNVVDDVVMLAQGGYCVPWDTAVDESCWNAQLRRHTCISSIIDKYREDKIAIDDAMQVRLFLNAAYGLNPASGITFKLYVRLPKAQERLDQLKNSVHAITDALFGEWLAEQLLSQDRPLVLSSEEFRAILKHYGHGNAQRQQAFFDAFKRRNTKQEYQDQEDRKDEVDAARREIDADLVSAQQQRAQREKGEAVSQIAARIAQEEIRSGGRENRERRFQAASLKEYAPASIWQEYIRNGNVANKEMVSLFMQDCLRDEIYNMRIPKKTSGIVRIATYNVHGWDDPLRKHNYPGIIGVIKNINADVIVLQEVTLFDEKLMKAHFNSLGYVYQTVMPRAGELGNMILSKYPFVRPPLQPEYKARHKDTRNFVNVLIQLPNKQIVSVYGTHLDVWDETGSVRAEQMHELLEYVQQDAHENVILAGDWNAVRRRDYDYQVADRSAWDLQTEQFLKRVGNSLNLINVPTEALDALEDKGFRDCFDAARILGPKYTVWTGTVVDFIFCAKTWNIPLDGCYIYFSPASDHLPVIMDARIVKTKFAKEREQRERGREQEEARDAAQEAAVSQQEERAGIKEEGTAHADQGQRAGLAEVQDVLKLQQESVRK